MSQCAIDSIASKCIIIPSVARSCHTLSCNYGGVCSFSICHLNLIRAQTCNTLQAALSRPRSNPLQTDIDTSARREALQPPPSRPRPSIPPRLRISFRLQTHVGLYVCRDLLTCCHHLLPLLLHGFHHCFLLLSQHSLVERAWPVCTRCAWTDYVKDRCCG